MTRDANASHSHALLGVAATWGLAGAAIGAGLGYLSFVPYREEIPGYPDAWTGGIWVFGVRVKAMGGEVATLLTIGLAALSAVLATAAGLWRVRGRQVAQGLQPTTRPGSGPALGLLYLIPGFAVLAAGLFFLVQTPVFLARPDFWVLVVFGALLSGVAVLLLTLSASLLLRRRWAMRLGYYTHTAIAFAAWGCGILILPVWLAGAGPGMESLVAIAWAVLVVPIALPLGWINRWLAMRYSRAVEESPGP